MSYAEWAKVLDVNTMGPVRVLDAFADRLAAAGAREGDHAHQRPGLDRRRGLGVEPDVPHLEGGGEHGDAGAVLQPWPARDHVAVINPGWVRTDMGGAGASISPEESVTAMRRIIAGLTPEADGSFLNWRGGGYPW